MADLLNDSLKPNQIRSKKLPKVNIVPCLAEVHAKSNAEGLMLTAFAPTATVKQIQLTSTLARGLEVYSNRHSSGGVSPPGLDNTNV